MRFVTRPVVRVLLPLLAVAMPSPGGTAETDDALRLQVESSALEALVRQVPSPDRFEVLSYRFGGVDALPAGAPHVETLEVVGPNDSGIIRMRFRVLVDGVPRGEARATVRGVVRGPALVARRALQRGQAIDPDDVELEDVDLTRAQGDPLRELESLVDLAPVRTLGAGRVITSALLEPAAVVRRGQRVELRVERRRMTVTAVGTVLRDGAPGETIPARNSTSGAEVLGRVQPDGSLLVLGAASEGRAR